MKHLLILLLLLFVPLKQLFCQELEFELELQAEPLLTNAQLIELTTITSNLNSQSSRLLTATISNFSGEDADDLYLDIDFNSERRGLLFESFQRNDSPFGLNEGQIALVTNNQIARGDLPNSTGNIKFDADLTDAGRDFLNELEGLTTFPADEYRVDVRLFKRNNSRNGGHLVASASIVIGGNLLDSDFSIFLVTPGDAAGTEATISNPFPEFRWEGLTEQQYRLIVVEKIQNDDPETLIESARSTEAASNGSASLLEHEFLDVIVQGTSFQYPSSGARSLRNGRTYYWQVSSDIQTTTDRRTRSSEIWSFQLSGGSGQLTGVSMDDELRLLIEAFIGSEKARQYRTRNLELFEIEIDGQTYSGEAARQQLLELLDKVNDNKVKLVD